MHDALKNHTELVNFFWNVADEVLHHVFVRSKYKDAILPFLMLRRIDGVLEATKPEVLAAKAKLDELGISNQDGQLRRASGHAFYNTSPYDFEKLLNDPANIGPNTRAYLNGFSENMRETLEKFGIRQTIDKLEEKGRLYAVIRKFAEKDLSPEKIDNHGMGSAFEELIRRFSEANNDEAGEHYTPREVVRLMVRLMLLGDEDDLKRKGRQVTISDPACGTGGMLSIAKEWLTDQINPDLKVHLFGQELNDETWAICRADLFLKGDEEGAANISSESTLSKDAHPKGRYDYQICNPPYGSDWKEDMEAVKAEANRSGGRFEADRLPASSDGQTLFLQHMLAKMNPVEQGGGRVAIVMNGSPLFNGDAGSGTSEFRRYVMEHDLLEAIIALPEQIFYNTGIATYVWLLSNRKRPGREAKVLLVNATDLWSPMKKSLGNKRREIGPGHAEAILAMVDRFEIGERCRVFPTTAFGYRKITVDRPLRLQADLREERMCRIEEVFDTANARELSVLVDMYIERGRNHLEDDYNIFIRSICSIARSEQIKLTAKARKLLRDTVASRYEDCKPVSKHDHSGDPPYEHDSELRDTESVPLGEDVHDYMSREVLPFVPDAWLNEGVRDEKDGGSGKVGYEINFNRVFYKYTPPRPLEDIEAELQALEDEIAGMIRQVVG